MAGGWWVVGGDRWVLSGAAAAAAFKACRQKNTVTEAGRGQAHTCLCEMLTRM
jgi:hypothetical protein